MRVGIPLGGWLMKLPWVSREAYEALTERYNRLGASVVERGQHIERLQTACHEHTGQYARAVETINRQTRELQTADTQRQELYDTVQALSGTNAKLTEMAERLSIDKLQLGAQLEDALARLAAIPAAHVPDQYEAEITKLIREQAGGNISLGAHLRRYAKSLKDAGDTPDQIIGKLVAWTTTEAE